MIRRNSEPAFVKACLVEYMWKYIEDDASRHFLAGVEEGQLDIQYRDAWSGSLPTYTLRFFVPVGSYDERESEWFTDRLKKGFGLMHEDDRSISVQVIFKAVPSLIPATESGLNHTHFKTEQTIPYDELRFRSQSEIAIYDELKRRNVLFFPNPAAILGRQSPEEHEKREPDFLICHRGKWGILEVSGEPWHSGQISTAKDHDRSRLFQHYGLVCIQHFDANRCRHSPADVVDEFLLLLAKS